MSYERLSYERLSYERLSYERLVVGWSLQGRRRRRRRRRRRAEKNSPRCPGPGPIAPRDGIVPQGETPHSDDMYFFLYSRGTSTRSHHKIADPRKMKKRGFGHSGAKIARVAWKRIGPWETWKSMHFCTKEPRSPGDLGGRGGRPRSAMNPKIVRVP